MKNMWRGLGMMFFGTSFVASVYAAMPWFVMDTMKVFCSPLCTAGPDVLIVKLTGNTYHWRGYVYLSQLSFDLIESLLKRAAQENRSDIVERILKECKYDFDLETIDYLLTLARGDEWSGRLVRALEAKKVLLGGSDYVPEGTRSDPE